MLGSTILDVAVGMIFVLLMASLVVTATNELIASFVSSSRAKHLFAGIQTLLGKGLAEELFKHPLIKGISASGGKPSYIPSRTFVQALLDQLASGKVVVSDILNVIPVGDLKRALSCLAVEAKDDVENFKISIEQWFNRAMDRVSGVYKRKTQWVTLGLGMLIAVLFNLDIVQIAKTLWNDPGSRAAMVAAAGKKSGSGTDQPAELRTQIEHLRALPIPIGWDSSQARPTNGTDLGYRTLYPPTSREFWDCVGFHVLGWMFVAVGASLGAPFWFDVLNKFMNVRGAGNAPEEVPRPPKELPRPEPPGGP